MAKITVTIAGAVMAAALLLSVGSVSAQPVLMGNCALGSVAVDTVSGDVHCTPPAVVVVTPPPPPPVIVASNCGMVLGGAVTFCEPFDAPAGIGNRAGDLDGNVWGASRIGQFVNFGQGQYNEWASTTILMCDGSTPTVFPPNDIRICNGQLREASNDNATGGFEAGVVTALAMYPKQPFDFAGRVGTVSFDVANDTHDNHAAWPEFWVTSLPVPAPFTYAPMGASLPQDGFGIRLSAQALPGQQNQCRNANNINVNRWTVDTVSVVRNYVLEDANNGGTDDGTPSNPPLTLTSLDCVISSPDGSGLMNHVEVRIVSPNQIDVYATDAGVAASPTTLRKIATITNAKLTLTRGLVWIEDAHYNADKGATPTQHQHTFVWDNVAFDGPFTYRDFSYDAPDANEPKGGNVVNLGRFSNANLTSTWSIPNIPANPNPSAVRVLFNFDAEVGNPTAFNVIVNGHAHSVPWPYPDNVQEIWRSVAVTIPVTDLVAGTNAVQLGGDRDLIVSNVNIVLVNVPSGVPVLPGNSRTYPTGQ